MRHMLIRAENEAAHVVAEAALPTEAELHDALTNHPQLIPAGDIGLGDTLVVGRESGLAAGYADLVLLDDRGRLCIVEVKNEGNPDTRRVVAQLLDYAASLWGLSVQEFEQRVLHPFLIGAGRAAPLPTVAEYFGEARQSGGGIDDLADQLAQTLAAGDFALVVAAPQIPVGVQRVLEYLNARGQRLFGLEVSYFRGPVECFVPRLVVKPLISDPAGESASGSPLDQETFLDQLPARCRDAIAGFLAQATDAGADVLWRKYGPSITVTRGQQQKQVAFVEPKRLGVTLKASADFPQPAFDLARTQLAMIGAGGETKDAWYYNISLIEADDAQIAAALTVATALVEALVPAVTFADLTPKLEATFSRNDHNVWARHVSTLSAHTGQDLLGRLRHIASGREVDVHLVPLANAQPGWRPRFKSASARDEVWSADLNGDEFRLIVDAAS